jgi:hypothetical protein
VKDAIRCILYDKEFVTAHKTCHDKDRLKSHVTAKNICVGGTDMAHDLGKFFVGGGRSGYGFYTGLEICDVFGRVCEYVR